MLPWHSLWVSVLKTLNCVLLFKIWRFLGLNSNLIWISGKNRCLDYHSPLFRLLISQIKNIVESLCIHAGKQTGPFLAMHLLGKQFPLVLGSFLILLHRPYRPWWLCTLSSHRFQGVGRGSPCGWCLLDWIWGWSNMVSNTKAIKQCRALSGAGIHPCQKHWTTVSDCVTTWISRSHFILNVSMNRIQSTQSYRRKHRVLLHCWFLSVLVVLLVFVPVQIPRVNITCHLQTFNSGCELAMTGTAVCSSATTLASEDQPF